MTDFEEDDFGSGGCSEKVTVLIALYATRSAEHTFFLGRGEAKLTSSLHVDFVLLGDLCREKQVWHPYIHPSARGHSEVR